MPSSMFAKEAVSATFDLWQTAPNGVSLAQKAGELAHAKQPASFEDRISLALTVVQTIDGLFRPVVELANLGGQTTSGAVASGAKVLGHAAGAASFASLYLRDQRARLGGMVSPSAP